MMFIKFNQVAGSHKNAGRPSHESIVHDAKQSRPLVKSFCDYGFKPESPVVLVTGKVLDVFQNEPVIDQLKKLESELAIATGEITLHQCVRVARLRCAIINIPEMDENGNSIALNDRYVLGESVPQLTVGEANRRLMALADSEGCKLFERQSVAYKEAIDAINQKFANSLTELKSAYADEKLILLGENPSKAKLKECKADIDHLQSGLVDEENRLRIIRDTELSEISDPSKYLDDKTVVGRWNTVAVNEFLETLTETFRHLEVPAIEKSFATMAELLSDAVTANMKDKTAIATADDDKIVIGRMLIEAGISSRELKRKIDPASAIVVMRLHTLAKRITRFYELPENQAVLEANRYDIWSKVVADPEAKLENDQVKFVDLVQNRPELTRLIFLTDAEFFKFEIDSWNDHPSHKKEVDKINPNDPKVDLFLIPQGIKKYVELEKANAFKALTIKKADREKWLASAASVNDDCKIAFANLLSSLNRESFFGDITNMIEKEKRKAVFEYSQKLEKDNASTPNPAPVITSESEIVSPDEVKA